MSIFPRSCVNFVRSAQAEFCMSISPRSYVDSSRCSLDFGSNLRNLHRGGELCKERGDESLMKLVESNLDSDFVSEKESDPIGVS